VISREEKGVWVGFFFGATKNQISALTPKSIIVKKKRVERRGLK